MVDDFVLYPLFVVLLELITGNNFAENKTNVSTTTINTTISARRK